MVFIELVCNWFVLVRLRYTRKNLVFYKSTMEYDLNFPM